VEFLEVSVDPARDNPARLKAYQKLYGAQPNWQFLTGTKAQIAAFWKAFHLYYKNVPNAPGETPHDWLTGRPLTYDVEHQNIVYIVGPDGHLAWLDVGTPWANHAPLPTTMRKYLSEDGVKNYTTQAQQSWDVPELLQALSYVTATPIPTSD
jgi:protein SCO1/2